MNGTALVVFIGRTNYKTVSGEWNTAEQFSLLIFFRLQSRFLEIEILAFSLEMAC